MSINQELVSFEEDEILWIAPPFEDDDDAILKEEVSVLLAAWAQAAHATPPIPTPDCLPFSQLQAFKDDRLHGEELREAVSHLAGCGFCLRMLKKLKSP